jgi:hypothetical protein
VAVAAEMVLADKSHAAQVAKMAKSLDKEAESSELVLAMKMGSDLCSDQSA